MHDAADHAAIVFSLDTSDVRWQMRFDPLPLFVAQPKLILAHNPNLFRNRIRIV